METARSKRYGVGIVFLVLVVALLALVPGVLAQGLADEESSLGAGISGYMQSTAADADGSVESGMWEEQFEGASEPDRAVQRRANSLRDRLTALQERSEELEAAKRDGTLSGVAYTARASAIHAQLAGLRASIDRTVDSAQRRNAGTVDLETLRESARTAAGPEVSAVGRAIANAGRGPPDGVPGRGEQPGSPGQPTDRGPPDDAPAGDGGPPDDSGAGTQGNSEGGPPAERGSDNRGGNGQSGEPGNSDDQGNNGQSGEPGNSDNRGNNGQSGESGNSDNQGGNGQSGESGNSDNQGGNGQSGESRNSDNQGGNSQSGEPGNNDGSNGNAGGGGNGSSSGNNSGGQQGARSGSSNGQGEN